MNLYKYLRIKYATLLDDVRNLNRSGDGVESLSWDEVLERNPNINPALIERFNRYAQQAFYDRDKLNSKTPEKKKFMLMKALSRTKDPWNKQLDASLFRNRFDRSTYPDPNNPAVEHNSDYSDYTAFGRNARKYWRWVRSDKFNPEQILGKTSSSTFGSNLSDANRVRLLDAVDSVQKYKAPDKLSRIYDETTMPMIMNELIDKGFTPDQAFVIYAAETWRPKGSRVLKEDKKENETPVDAVAPTTTVQEGPNEEQTAVTNTEPVVNPEPVKSTPYGRYASIGAGSVVGGGLGYLGSNALSKYIGLKGGGKENDFLHKRLGIDPNSKYRKYGDITLRTLGTLGGATAGGLGADALYNKYSK